MPAPETPHHSLCSGDGIGEHLDFRRPFSASVSVEFRMRFRFRSSTVSKSISEMCPKPNRALFAADEPVRTRDYRADKQLSSASCRCERDAAVFRPSLASLSHQTAGLTITLTRSTDAGQVAVV